MSPLVEMLPLLNRNWKFRFLMRWKRGFLILGRTVSRWDGGCGAWVERDSYTLYWGRKGEP